MSTWDTGSLVLDAIFHNFKYRSVSSPHDTIKCGCFLLKRICLTGNLWILSICLLAKSVNSNLSFDFVSSKKFTEQWSKSATATKTLHWFIFYVIIFYVKLLESVTLKGPTLTERMLDPAFTLPVACWKLDSCSIFLIRNPFTYAFYKGMNIINFSKFTSSATTTSKAPSSNII